MFWRKYVPEKVRCLPAVEESSMLVKRFGYSENSIGSDS
jgi:hypothetical protein